MTTTWTVDGYCAVRKAKTASNAIEQSATFNSFAINPSIGQSWLWIKDFFGSHFLSVPNLIAESRQKPQRKCILTIYRRNESFQALLSRTIELHSAFAGINYGGNGQKNVSQLQLLLRTYFGTDSVLGGREAERDKMMVEKKIHY